MPRGSETGGKILLPQFTGECPQRTGHNLMTKIGTRRLAQPTPDRKPFVENIFPRGSPMEYLFQCCDHFNNSSPKCQAECETFVPETSNAELSWALLSLPDLEFARSSPQTDRVHRAQGSECDNRVLNPLDLVADPIAADEPSPRSVTERTAHRSWA